MKTVRGGLERQAGQIKKLEVNEAELLRRRNFEVMIYQVSWRADRAQEPGVPRPGIRVRRSARGASLAAADPARGSTLFLRALLGWSKGGVAWVGGQALSAQRGAQCTPRLLAAATSGVQRVAEPS